MKYKTRAGAKESDDVKNKQRGANCAPARPLRNKYFFLTNKDQAQAVLSVWDERFTNYAPVAVITGCGRRPHILCEIIDATELPVNWGNTIIN